MAELGFGQAQADMRDAHFNGAAGVVASGVVWAVAGGFSVALSHRAGVYALLAGGALIFPLGVLLAKLLGRRGMHARGNPLGTLAQEGTFWLMAGIVVAFALSLQRVEWFLPAMLLAIGARYLTFQTLYGLRTYWVLGGALCALAVAVVLLRLPPPLALFGGGVLEIAFALALFRQRPAAA